MNEDPDRYRELERRSRRQTARDIFKAFAVLLFAALVIATCYRLVEGQQTGHKILTNIQGSQTQLKIQGRQIKAQGKEIKHLLMVDTRQQQQAAADRTKINQLLVLAGVEVQNLNNKVDALLNGLSIPIPAPVPANSTIPLPATTPTTTTPPPTHHITTPTTVPPHTTTTSAVAPSTTTTAAGKHHGKPAKVHGHP